MSFLSPVCISLRVSLLNSLLDAATRNYRSEFFSRTVSSAVFTCIGALGTPNRMPSVPIDYDDPDCVYFTHFQRLQLRSDPSHTPRTDRRTQDDSKYTALAQRRAVKIQAM